MILREHFKDRFNELQTALGWTDRQMAAVCGTSLPTIQRWRDGVAAPHPIGRMPIISALRRHLESTNG